MTNDAREVFEFDQERAHARRFAEALANDVITYHGALTKAGIDAALVATLVAQFNTAWLGAEARDQQVVFSIEGLED